MYYSLMGSLTPVSFTTASTDLSATYNIRDLFSVAEELHGATPDTTNTPGNTWAVALGSSGKFDKVAAPSDHLRNTIASDGWGAGIDCGQENKRVEANVEIATSVAGTTIARLLTREGGGASYCGAMITRTSATTATLNTVKIGGGTVLSATIAIDGTQNAWEIVIEDISDGLIAWDAAAPGTKTVSLDVSGVAVGTQLAGVRRLSTDLVAVTDVKYRDFRVTLL